MSELARVPVGSVPDGKAVRIAGGPNGICLVRLGERFYAVEDRCSHAEVLLSEGEIDDEERTIECWKHGSTFSLLDGRPQSLPATRPVAVYVARVEDGEVIVMSEAQR
jgi:3-phenylpropionate/trans-cinnamate dioxygenase ferredoxin component